MANIAGVPVPDQVLDPDFPEKAIGLIDRVNDWIARKQGISFLVFGVRASGKSSFLRALRGLSPDLLEMATQNPKEIGEFKVFLEEKNERPLVIHDTVDLPGQDEEALQMAWETALNKIDPSGIVYIIDDFVAEERIMQHRAGLQRLINILISEESGVEQVLVLFNRSRSKGDMRKQVLGEPSGEDLPELRQHYSDLLRQIEEIMLNFERDVELFGQSEIRILGRRLIKFGMVKGWFYIDEADIFDENQLVSVMARYFDLLILPSNRPNN